MSNNKIIESYIELMKANKEYFDVVKQEYDCPKNFDCNSCHKNKKCDEKERVLYVKKLATKAKNRISKLNLVN